MSSKALISTAQKIKDMRIRGASKIARAAAEAMAEEARSIDVQTSAEFLERMRNAEALLLSTRPTAVSLPNALAYVMAPLEASSAREPEGLRAIVVERAREFVENSQIATEKLGKIGAGLLGQGAVIMTHCHSLAVISIVKEATEEGKVITAYVKETRPRHQGLITAKMLSAIGAKVLLIVDSAASYYMDRVDAVLIGADAIALDGSVVNKIGTHMTTLAAAERHKPVFVAAETYKIALRYDTGSAIPIELRGAQEVVTGEFLEHNPRVQVLNPSFDVADPSTISKIVTEVGILDPPFPSSIKRTISGLGYGARG
jgi:ribose 1,5-bisphosphate isomerase